MLSSPLLDALKPLRVPRPGLRPLTETELGLLRAQGNLFQTDSELLAARGFDASKVHSNRFVGRVVLSGEIYQSVLEDVEVENGALIDRCPLVRRVGSEATLRNSTVDCTSATTYGVGTVIKAGLESPGREIQIWDNMTLADGERYLTDPNLQAEVATLVRTVVFDRSVGWRQG